MRSWVWQNWVRMWQASQLGHWQEQQNLIGESPYRRLGGLWQIQRRSGLSGDQDNIRLAGGRHIQDRWLCWEWSTVNPDEDKVYLVDFDSWCIQWVDSMGRELGRNEEKGIDTIGTRELHDIPHDRSWEVLDITFLVRFQQLNSLLGFMSHWCIFWVILHQATNFYYDSNHLSVIFVSYDFLEQLCRKNLILRFFESIGLIFGKYLPSLGVLQFRPCKRTS